MKFVTPTIKDDIRLINAEVQEETNLKDNAEFSLKMRQTGSGHGPSIQKLSVIETFDIDNFI